MEAQRIDRRPAPEGGDFAAWIAKVRGQVELPRHVFDVLATIPTERRDLNAKQRLYDQGSAEDRCYVVQEGWLIAFTLLPEGARYVHHIHQAGDIVGVEDIHWNYSTCTVQAVTPSRLASFPKHDHFRLFEESPKLGAAFHGLTMCEQVAMMDRARANARLDSGLRIAHLLLQVEARQRLSSGAAPGSWFDFPLTQEQIADTVGLTSVHASRMVRQLTAEGGPVEREGRRYRLVQRDMLVDRTDFVDRYVITNDRWVRLLAA